MPSAQHSFVGAKRATTPPFAVVAHAFVRNQRQKYVSSTAAYRTNPSACATGISAHRPPLSRWLDVAAILHPDGMTFITFTCDVTSRSPRVDMLWLGVHV